MKFYTFVQKNSGGYFAGPAQYVIIEAQDAGIANYLAERAGLYFNGASEDGPDCPCCGSRWYQMDAEDKGTDTPMIYSMPADESRSDTLVIYNDGRTMRYGGAY